MTAIVKKIKVGLSQEEIDKLKPSVIDLGTISSSFQSSVCEDLDGITEIGMYTFKYGNTRYMMNVEKVQTGATTYSTFQYIYTKPDVYFTRVKHGTSWSYSGAKYLADSTTSVTSGNTSNKIFLVGRTSQSIIGGTAFSHDTVYVDTDGHLYDSGKRVLTTADNVSGGSTAQSVIDLGVLTGTPFTSNHEVLDNITTPALYTFVWMNTSFLMNVYVESSEVVVQNITGITRYYQRIKTDGTWSFSSYDYNVGGGTSEDIANLKENGYYSVSNTMPDDEKAQWNVGNVDSDLQLIGQGDRPTYYSESGGSQEVALLSDIQNEIKLHVYETSNKVQNKDFHQVMLYALQNAPEEMPFAIRLIVGYSGNRYQFIGVKKNLGTTHCVYLLDLQTYRTYKSNQFHYQTDYSTVTLDDITVSISKLIEGIPTSLAGFSSYSAGIYGTTLTSGLYSFNCLLDDGNYLNFTMDLNKDASYTQVSPIIRDVGEGSFERLSYYQGTLKYVDQDGQPLSSFNTIQIRRLYSY